MDLGRWLRNHAVAVAGAVLVLVGVILFATGAGSVTTFGWTSYTPFQDYDSKRLPVVYLNPQRLAGSLSTLVGLILLAGAFGFRLGARRASPQR